MAIREYIMNIEKFEKKLYKEGMPVTFQGNIVGHIMNVSGDKVLMCIDNDYVHSMMKDDGVKFSLEVSVKK